MKESKVYVLSVWNYDFGNAEITVYEDRQKAYLNRPYILTVNQAKILYGYYWQDYSFWKHCVIDCYDSIEDYNNGSDPIYTKTYYK